MSEPTLEPTGIPMPDTITPQRCRSCNAPIYWAVTAHGRSCPYNVARDADGNPVVGQSHFKTCNDPNGWSKRDAKRK